MRLADKNQCCGCMACVQRCAVHALTREIDAEGFAYPHVQTDRCVTCGACEAVCPVVNPLASTKPLSACAAKFVDRSWRERSSSGGVFAALALETLRNGGIVYGVAFAQNGLPEHRRVTDEAELASLCGSKYAASDPGVTYLEAARDLDEGRRVLYVGTPCQVAGLRKSLGGVRENLVLVDFVCHGVASPGMWQRYMEEMGVSDRKDVSFRDKSSGWRRYSVRLGNRRCVHWNDPYMKGFLANLTLRPSCHVCAYKNANSSSDLTLGDYWRARSELPNFYDASGVSAVVVNTVRGQQLLQKLALETVPVPYARLVDGNESLTMPSRPHPARAVFWNRYQETGDFRGTVHAFVPDRPFSLKRTFAEIVGSIIWWIRRAR